MERSMYRSSLIIIASLVGIALVVTLGLARVDAAVETSASCDIAKDAFCIAPRASGSVDALRAATVPKIATPAWLQAAPETSRTVTYRVETRGTITTDLAEFKASANQTLNDSRGWSRLGVRFDQVETDGDFVLVLSEASQMTTFSATGCDTTYSCVVGVHVIINQDRWLNATPSWTEGGASLVDYRHMVVNHETGHWLGHGHTYCGTKGQPSTVMQQQSMSLQGCTANAWPLASELYSPTLGIRS
ncbi:DUF3152 domain-containing protein [Pedobacter sp.]|nr:DUF3152 domain-containing protein [Candidatus Saccharibacteria bacterium]